jgi:hypothetical protein
MKTTEQIFKLHDQLFQELLEVDVQFYTDEDRDEDRENLYNAPVIHTNAEKGYKAFVQKLKGGYVYAYDVERDVLSAFKMNLLDRSEVLMLAQSADL